MKTIKEWFESVENAIFRKVLLMRYNNSEEPVTHLIQAIWMGINFSDTVEGFDFWKNVWNELQTSKESPTFNAKYPVMQVEWLDVNECIWCETEEEKKYIQTLLYQNDIKYGGTGHIDREDYYYLPKCHWMDVKTFNPKNYIIYPAKLFIKDMKQDLLEEAKRRYPIGCIIKTDDDRLILKVKSIEQFGEYLIAYGDLINKLGYYDYGGKKYSFIPYKSSVLYVNNQWAEYVEVFGFKVGDVIDKDILNKWEHEERFKDKWKLKNIDWSFNPEIQNINYIDNHICLNLRGIWIKAEGLREFIELEKLKQDAEKAEKEFINCLNEFN